METLARETTAPRSESRQGHAVSEEAREVGAHLALWGGALKGLTWKEKVAFVGVTMLGGAHDAPLPVEHSIGRGLYIRKLRIPAGKVFIGRGHKVGHEVTLLSGAVILITEHAQRELGAVKTIHTSPGYHVVCYTLTDIEAQTVHPNPTNSYDLAALEAEIFEPVAALTELGHAVARRLT